MTTEEENAEFETKKAELENLIVEVQKDLNGLTFTVREFNEKLGELRTQLAKLHVTHNRKRFPSMQLPDTRINLS